MNRRDGYLFRVNAFVRNLVTLQPNVRPEVAKAII